MKWILSLFLIGSVAQGQLTTQKIDVLFGNKNTTNFIKNPDCDKNTLGLSETGSGTISRGSAPANNHSDGINGKTYCSFDAAASGDILTFETIDLSGGLLGRNCEVSFYYAFGNGLYKAYAQNAAGVKSAEVQLSEGTDGTFAKGPVTLTVPCGGTSGFLSSVDTVAPVLKIESTSASATAIYIGQVQSGAITSIGIFNNVIDWVSYTPTYTGFGTTSSNEAYYAIVGDSMYVRGQFQVGTVTGSTAAVSFPTGFTSATTAKIGSITKFGAATNVNSTTFHVLVSPSSTGINFSTSSTTALTGSGTSLTPGQRISYEAGPIPMQGLSANTTAAAANQTDWDWRDETCTGSWSTNTTYACKSSNKGGEISIKAKVSTSGAPTSAALTITLPNSWVIDTARIPGTVSTATDLSVAGSVSDSATTFYKGYAYYNNTTSVRIMSSGSTVTAVTQAAPFTFGASDVVEVEFKLPIVGFVSNQRAPTLMGSVTSNSAVAEKIERAEINCDAASGITSQSGTWITTIGNRSSASCALTLAAGFSAAPVCNFTIKAATVNATSVSCASATSCTLYGPSADYDGYLICMGSR